MPLDLLQPNDDNEPGVVTKALPRVFDGDDGAVEVLVNFFQSSLEKNAKNKLKGKDVYYKDECDATQSVWLAFVNKLREGRLPDVTNQQSFEKVVSTFAKNKARDYIKTEARKCRDSGRTIHSSTTSIELESRATSEESCRVQTEEILELFSCEKNKAIVQLTIEGFSRSEIAKKLNISERCVYRRLETARAEISKYLEP